MALIQGATETTKRKKKKRTSVNLRQETIDAATILGGNNSEGIDKLFRQLPVFLKAKTAIEMLLEGHPMAREYAEAVLKSYEDLEIEQTVKEAKLECDLIFLNRMTGL